MYKDDDGVTWYYCGTCGFSFPGSEIRSHKGHKYWEM